VVAGEAVVAPIADVVTVVGTDPPRPIDRPHQRAAIDRRVVDRRIGKARAEERAMPETVETAKAAMEMTEATVTETDLHRRLADRILDRRCRTRTGRCRRLRPINRSEREHNC